ncbi:bifunctional GNAT family N-acetyltransferase/class I SAM-dependent methyltransferase [Treponema brennaborense]|uniref:GCN5-related N-acetyltransferase n=1 Tax=Treponema brennaborense (strain DSM 12168 / CIP 105900 / DD5/3) TaxID=906968 RepID=F4LIJ2_TREBD|nr:bifunctional GNAT family N-acetyltransferase/class I SAM-dependent methyltransferase [Treponema brennaborense]AEE17217.1 GCN5-related N-acetyltransferase [Treponema brennaborense DSM 12168]
MDTIVSFRFARKQDIPLILSFIKELAVYEQLETQIVADEALLTEWIFDRRKAEVIFAEAEGTTVGFALFFHNFSTFLGRAGIYLEDLFVKEAFRGKGYGKALLQKLAALTVERGCGRLEWSCLNWNTPSIRFYRSFGAQPMNEWTVETYTHAAAAFEAKIAALANYDDAYRDFAHLIPPGGSLLDLACGPANASKKITSYAPLPLKITGIDLSDGMLELACKNLPEARFFKQSIIDFTVADGFGTEVNVNADCGRQQHQIRAKAGFDAAVNAFGLPYLTPEQAEASFAATFRALAPNGVVYLSFMEGSGVRMESASFWPDEPMQIHYHREHDVRRLLEKTGFSIISARHIPYAEKDGSVTTDVILFCRKAEPAR